MLYQSDVDCGGPCAACAAGKACFRATDCSSGVCSDGVCAAPACDDSVLNGNERDVDCGGGVCDTCATGLNCVSGFDCASGVCSGGECAAPTCSDGVRNGGEAGVDCGEPATGCSPCPVGTACATADGCASGICRGTFRAVPAC